MQFDSTFLYLLNLLLYIYQNQVGFLLISSSFSGGRIFCTFTRSILADNVNEDRNLAQSAFLLLAVDDARGRHEPCTAATCSVYLMSPEMLPLYSCTPLAVTVTSYCLLSLHIAPPGQDVVLAAHANDSRWASADQVVLVPPMVSTLFMSVFISIQATL